jgi:hypothetical protein
MFIEMNFIPILNALVEPNLKLIIQCYQIRIDDDPYIEFGYDPLIGSQNLTMPRSENIRFIYKDRPEQEIPEVVFRSEKYNELAKIFLRIRPTLNDLRVIVEGGENGLRYAAGFVKRAAIPGVSDDPYGALYRMLAASVELTVWDEDAKALKCDARKVSLYISPALAKEIAANTEVEFAINGDNEILLAERELRS